MKRVLEIGGFIAGAVLVAFGIAVIVLGVNGRSTVNSSLKQESIVGTPDMTPALIKAEAAKAGLTGISFPSHSVAGKAITDGSSARSLRAVHAHPRARGERRADVRRDGPVRDRRRQADRHERRRRRPCRRTVSPSRTRHVTCG